MDKTEKRQYTTLYDMMNIKIDYLRWIDIQHMNQYYGRGHKEHYAVDAVETPEALDAMVFNWLLSTRENKIDKLRMKVHTLNDHIDKLSRYTQKCTYIAVATSIVAILAVATSCRRA